ncbi:MAG TPA: hypothetical protein V6C88_13980 [Chroococcidiopsis sp.]
MIGALSALALTATAALAQSREVWLASGESTMVEGYFNAGETIYGSCDADCSDMDLTLYDESGNAVASDNAYDANPIVTAPNAGYYQIEVVMASCSTAQCAAWVDSDAGF